MDQIVFSIMQGDGTWKDEPIRDLEVDKCQMLVNDGKHPIRVHARVLRDGVQVDHQDGMLAPCQNLEKPEAGTRLKIWGLPIEVRTKGFGVSIPDGDFVWVSFVIREHMRPIEGPKVKCYVGDSYSFRHMRSGGCFIGALVRSSAGKFIAGSHVHLKYTDRFMVRVTDQDKATAECDRNGEWTRFDEELVELTHRKVES